MALIVLACLSAVVQGDFGPWGYSSPTPAVYTMSNSPDGNKVYVYGVNQGNGALTFSNSVSTGGTGAGSLHSNFGLVTNGNYLLAVNGGSNSISLFRINSNQPTSITLSDTEDVQGTFPTSIGTTSSYGGIACVATSKGNLTLSCFQFGASGLTYIPQWTRSLGIYVDDDSVPLSQISFSPNGKFLILQFKGIPQVAYMIFPIINGALAMNPIVTPATNPIGPASYGFQFGSATNTIVSNDAAASTVSAYTFSAGAQFVNNSNAYSSVTVNGSKAFCWIVKSTWTNHYYSIAAGTGNVTETGMNSYNGKISYITTTNSPLTGLTDAVIIHPTRVSGCEWLYVISKQGISLWKIDGPGWLSYTSVVPYPNGESNTTVGGIAAYPSGVSNSN